MIDVRLRRIVLRIFSSSANGYNVPLVPPRVGHWLTSRGLQGSKLTPSRVSRVEYNCRRHLSQAAAPISRSLTPKQHKKYTRLQTISKNVYHRSHCTIPPRNKRKRPRRLQHNCPRLSHLYHIIATRHEPRQCPPLRDVSFLHDLEAVVTIAKYLLQFQYPAQDMRWLQDCALLQPGIPLPSCIVSSSGLAVDPPARRMSE